MNQSVSDSRTCSRCASFSLSAPTALRRVFPPALGLLMFLLAHPTAASAQGGGACSLIGPVVFERATGAPRYVETAFSYSGTPLQATLRVNNALPGFPQVTSASVVLNGNEVLSPADFQKTKGLIEISVPALPANILRVEVRSKPGSAFSIEVTVADLVAPSIVAAIDPSLPGSGWANRDETVSFTCADAVCGVKSCTAPTFVSSEGVTEVVGRAEDRAGNVSTLTIPVRIDRSPPLITATMAPPPNAQGWNNSDVVLNYFCSDVLAGVASCPPSQTVASEGFDQGVPASAIDLAGNVALLVTKLNIDKTPPVVAAVRTPTPDAQGWNSSDVIVRYECSDALSAVVDCPRNVYFRVEGEQQPFSATIHDAAGNIATTTGAISIRRDASVIDGSVDPAAIPDRVAYPLLFGLIYRPQATDKANEQASSGLLRSAGLDDAAIAALRQAATDLRRETIPIEQQAIAIREREWPSPSPAAMAELRALQIQKNAVVEAAVAALPSKLGSGGFQQLSEYMNTKFKRGVKILPDDPLPVGQRPGGQQ